MKKEKFDQNKYIQSYIKEHKSRFSTDLNKNEYEELQILLKKNNMNKAEFVRWAFDKLKKETSKR